MNIALKMKGIVIPDIWNWKVFAFIFLIYFTQNYLIS
jgi:hypothetical protein